MSETYLDDLLDQLVTVEPHPAWDDVLARTRRSRRRYGALVALVALFVLVPAAWAVDGAFFGSAPPPEIQSRVAFLNEYAPIMVQQAAAAGWPDPEQYGTTADVSQLRGVMQVHTPYGPLDVWAAPSSIGGLCWWTEYESFLNARPEQMPEPGGGGGCSMAGDSQITTLGKNYSAAIGGAFPGVTVHEGYTDNPNAASVELTLQQGDKVITASGPVVEGIYVIVTPRDPSLSTDWDTAHTGILKIVTYDASGNEVETWKNPWQIPCPKPAGQGPCTPATP
jgi:hypothetical protein